MILWILSTVVGSLAAIFLRKHFKYKKYVEECLNDCVCPLCGSTKFQHSMMYTEPWVNKTPSLCCKNCAGEWPIPKSMNKEKVLEARRAAKQKKLDELLKEVN